MKNDFKFPWLEMQTKKLIPISAQIGKTSFGSSRQQGKGENVCIGTHRLSAVIHCQADRAGYINWVISTKLIQLNIGYSNANQTNRTITWTITIGLY